MQYLGNLVQTQIPKTIQSCPLSFLLVMLHPDLRQVKSVVSKAAKRNWEMSQFPPPLIKLFNAKSVTWDVTLQPGGH